MSIKIYHQNSINTQEDYNSFKEYKPTHSRTLKSENIILKKNKAQTVLFNELSVLFAFLFSKNGVAGRSIVIKQSPVCIAHVSVTRRLVGRRRKTMADYSESLLKYRVAMSTVNILYNEGIITEKDYVTIDTIMAKKYGLSLDHTPKAGLCKP